MAYAGRLAIIAGGFGGLGSATGKLLRSQGAKLALLYAPFEANRRNDVLQNTYGVTSSSSSGGGSKDITAYECDITSESSVQKVFDEIATATNNKPKGNADDASFPSILINAAGYVTVQPLEETSAEEASRNIVSNIMGPFLVSKAFYRLYQARVKEQQQQNGGHDPPPGRIVSLSSQASHVALDGHGPYCASKAGLNGLTRCMANEWGRRGITSNTVSPTVVLTELGKKAWADPEKRDKHLAEIPVGRFSEPHEIASAIEFLCRDDSGMINGADLRVDGGFTIR